MAKKVARMRPIKVWALVLSKNGVVEGVYTDRDSAAAWKGMYLPTTHIVGPITIRESRPNPRAKRAKGGGR